MVVLDLVVIFGRMEEWPWRARGQVRRGPYVVAFVVKVTFGGGLAVGVATDPLTAVMLGVAAPLIVERVLGAAASEPRTPTLSRKSKPTAKQSRRRSTEQRRPLRLEGPPLYPAKSQTLCLKKTLTGLSIVFCGAVSVAAILVVAATRFGGLIRADSVLLFGFVVSLALVLATLTFAAYACVLLGRMSSGRFDRRRYDT